MDLDRQKTIKVLLVEDNVDYAIFMRAMLARAQGISFEPTSVQFLKEAIAAVAETNHDIMLLDLSLPDSRGLNTFFAASQAAPELPIIILTGIDDEALALKAMQAGAQDYLNKGHLDGPLLIQAIRYAIERHHSAKALRQTERRFRKIIEHNADGIIIIDKDGIIRLINKAGEALFGYDSLALVGTEFSIPFVDDEMAELEIVNKAGQIITVELRIVEIDWADEKANLASLRDITARIRTEEELRSSEERFRRVIASISDHIYVGSVTNDNQLKTIYLSPHVESLTGYSYETLMEDWRFWASEIIHPDDQAKAAGQLTRLIYGEESEVEYRLIRADGEITWVRDSARSETSQEHGVIIYGVVSEITERKGLEAQLRQAQKMEALGQLAGGVAHDFNNLLTVIIGYSRLLIQTYGSDFSEYGYLQEITESAERAAELTRQLLAFSRNQVMEVQIIDLNTIVSNLERMLRRLIGEDIELIVRLDADLARIKADLNQMEQVIMNLAVNARDAMPNGGKLTIQTMNVSLNEAAIMHQTDLDLLPGDYVLLHIQDTGMGMDERTRARIFEPFFTTKEMGKGTGLGLATVHGVIKQSDGSISVISAVGKGTTFQIFLAATQEPQRIARISEQDTENLAGSETILLVEDEEKVRTLAHKILCKQGYSLLQASHGEEAVQICRAYPGDIDLLITDMVMPGGMNGHQLAKTIIAIRPTTKILYMSGYTKDLRFDRTDDLANAAFLPKPFTPNLLAGKVRQVLSIS